ncbi:hypothetical protein N7468_001860 [Penicillium chermesinum]|uniref:Pre-mRNA splicing factor CLF1 n=1 Tax=Penicillium chermesinum TaxID=63820 RepID=A0A9W9TXG4_9EURO|nr:uncharacterized protein N7468_001860 [Penicillium chermesinum]KAJ5246877.1 hypothetical protein N7468_001860 [Penicillium chermesinum]
MGFQKIDLKTNGTWKSLDTNVQVTDPACTVGDIGGDASNQALYLVGGTGSPSGYAGLQRYSFNEKKWTTLTSESSAMVDRTSHTVGYVPGTSTLVVVGSDGSTTWTISTKSDSTSMDIEGGTPGGMGPVTTPTILPWNDTSIALVSGDGGNGAVSIFDSQASHWVDSYAALPAGAVKASSHLALISDSDGNYVLQDFNMAAKPNTVTSYQLYKKGKPQNPAKEVGGSSSKRSLDDLPAYNGSFAGETTRSDYALAQSGNQPGLVVIGSGDDDNALSIFDQSSNGWANATELFYGSPNKQSPLHATTTSSSSTSTPTPTSSTVSSSSAVTTTPAATSPTAAPSSGGSGVNLGVIIGATLGSCCGAILILLILLFLLRRARQKKQAGEGAGGDPKGRLSFQDQGIEPLADSAYPMARSPVPVAAVSNDSLAIMSGRYTAEKSLQPPPPQSYGYGLSHSKGLSPIASSGLAPSSMYSDATAEPSPTASATNKPGDRTTDEGWGKYFEESNPRDQAGRATGSPVSSVYGADLPAQAPEAGTRSAVSSFYTDSDYRGSAWPMSNLAPLNFAKLDRPQPLGLVATLASSSPEGQSARISSADSISLNSEDDPHDTNWTGAQNSSWLGRPPSSQYSTSFYNNSTHNLPGSFHPRQSNDMRSHGRRSSVVIPDNIDELPTRGTAPMSTPI